MPQSALYESACTVTKSSIPEIHTYVPTRPRQVKIYEQPLSNVQLEKKNLLDPGHIVLCVPFGTGLVTELLGECCVSYFSPQNMMALCTF